MVASNKLRKIIFWCTIILGLILPIAGVTAEMISLKDKPFFTAVKLAFLFFGQDLLMVLTWIWQDVPFIFLAFFIKSRLTDYRGSAKWSIFRLSEAIVAWILVVVLSFLVYLEVLLNSYHPSPLSIMLYIFLPFWEILILILVYAFGLVLGKLLQYQR